MTIKQRILVVEDEVKIAQLHLRYLEKAGFDTHHIERGDEVIPYIENNEVDLIVLDVMLPGMDGFSICKEIRTFSEIPIIIVSAKVEDFDRLIGLEIGADDYVIKPFNPNEVVARVKAVLKRSTVIPESANESLTIEELNLDGEQKKVFINENDINLTLTEFLILKTFMKRQGRVYSRPELISFMQDEGEDYIVSDRTIDTHIKNLRKKIAKEIPNKVFIHSMYGAGYRFSPEEKKVK
ncbi:MAG: response regulator [Fibrobacterales bacterium]